VAQAETPKPLNFCSDGRSSQRACAAGRDHHRVGDIDVARVAFDPERALLEIEPGHMVGDEPRADMLGLLLHLLHQPGALDHLGKARIVLHVGRDGELAAGLLRRGSGSARASRAPHRSRRCIRRAGADDDQLGVGNFGHESAPGPAEMPLTRALKDSAGAGSRPSRVFLTEFKVSAELCKIRNPEVRNSRLRSVIGSR
jgi:hypothetical protein